jgi:hypothetical protein
MNSLINHSKVDNSASRKREIYDIQRGMSPMGSSLPVCTPLTCPLNPSSTQAKFVGAHVLEPLRSHIRSFGTLRQLFKKAQLSTRIYHSAGGRGVPKFLWGLKSSYFCYLGAHAKFQNPTTISFVRMSNELERREKKEKEMPFIVATSVCACIPRAAQALRSDQWNHFKSRKFINCIMWWCLLIQSPWLVSNEISKKGPLLFPENTFQTDRTVSPISLCIDILSVWWW